MSRVYGKGWGSGGLRFRFKGSGPKVLSLGLLNPKP